MLSLPSGKRRERSSDLVSEVGRVMKKRGLTVRSYHDPLIDHFASGSNTFTQISRPFSPDIIVYCKSNYLFLEKDTGNKRVHDYLNAFEERFSYLPKVIVEENGGLIIIEENVRAIETVLEVFYDMMKISYLSEQFGGPHFMTEEQIAFIDSWEVENYRRSVARKIKP